MAMVTGAAIARGYPYRLRVSLAGAGGAAAPGLFPAGAALKAHVRVSRAAPASLGDLTTGNGRLVRVSDSVIDITIPPDITGQLPAGGFAHIDLARTDLDPDEYLGLYLRIPVLQPVTTP